MLLRRGITTPLPRISIAPAVSEGAAGAATTWAEGGGVPPAAITDQPGAEGGAPRGPPSSPPPAAGDPDNPGVERGGGRQKPPQAARHAHTQAMTRGELRQTPLPRFMLDLLFTWTADENQTRAELTARS